MNVETREKFTLIAVSSFGESLRWDPLTAPAEAIFKRISSH